MAEKNKKRDPMPPPDATPEEIGEFWDTHSLADYWDETHEVEFQVNLKSLESVSPDETEAVEQGWKKLKELIQSLDEQHKGRKKGEPFEEFVAKLLELLLEIPFVLAKSGTQPSGDARNMTGEVAIQAKNYSNTTEPRDVEIIGDIDIVNENLQDLQVYVLVISRDIPAQLLDKLEKKKKILAWILLRLNFLMSYQIWGYCVLLTGRISAISFTCQTLIQNFQIGFK